MANELVNQLITVTIKSGGATPLADTDGNNLLADYSFCYYSCFCPYYSSVQLTRLRGGSFLNALSDEVIALTIATTSLNTDVEIQSSCATMVCCGDDVTGVNRALLYAKISYVTNLVLIDLLTAIIDKFAGGKSKRLADLSISYDVSSIRDRISRAVDDNNFLRRYILSCGNVGKGTSVKPCVAVKGGWNPNEPWVGRDMGSSRGPLNQQEDELFVGITKNRPRRFFGPTGGNF